MTPTLALCIANVVKRIKRDKDNNNGKKGKKKAKRLLVISLLQLSLPVIPGVMFNHNFLNFQFSKRCINSGTIFIIYASKDIYTYIYKVIISIVLAFSRHRFPPIKV